MATYTVMIEYVEPPNACEIMGGRDLFTVDADDEEMAVEAVRDRIAAGGYAGGYSVLGALKGAYADGEDFCATVRAKEQEVEDEVISEMEEDLWEQYVEECEAEEESSLEKTPEVVE